MNRYAFILLLCFVFGHSLAQLSADKKPKSLSTALTHYQKNDEVFFSYDAELLDQVEIDFAFESLPIDTFIQKLSQQKPISFQNAGDNFYTIQVEKAEFEILLSDIEDSEKIPFGNINVLVNGQPIERKLKGEVITFEYKPALKDTLTIYALGYDIWKISNHTLLNQTHFAVQLSPKTINLAGLVVTDYLTKGINLNAASQSIEIKVVDLPLLPSETDGDLFASLVALPGVSTPDNRPGNLYIRGSSTDQSLILYDDIPIYHRGHYYGMISPYNPLVVDKVNVYRSGMHPSLGGRVGGAVVINSTDIGQPENHVGISSNLLYGQGYVKAPLMKGKLGLSLSARKSYPVGFNSVKLKSMSNSVFASTAVIDAQGNFPDEFDVDFEDYAAKLVYRINDKNKLSLSGIYAKNDVRYSIVEQDSKDVNGFTNAGLNLSWKADISQTWKNSFSATYSDYSSQFLVNEAIEAHGPNLPGVFSLNTLKDFGVNEQVSYHQSGYSVQVGMDYKYQNVTYESKDNANLPPYEKVYRAQKIKAHTLAPYVNYEWTSIQNLYVQLGIRGSYYSLLENFRLEPRLFANYDLSPKFQLKGSAGLYNQYLGQVKNLGFSKGGFDNELWLLANKETSGITSGYQLMFGGLFHAKSFVLDIEVYSKTAERVNYYSLRKFASNGKFLTGTHDMYGVDIFVKQQVNEQISIWAGYTYSQIKLTMDTAKNISYDLKYSQPHNIYVGGAYSKQHWKLSAGWKLTSGLNAQSIDVLEVKRAYERKIKNSPPDSPPPVNPFANLPDRYPMVHMLDVSASYKLPKTLKRPFSATFGLSLINIFNSVNLTDRLVRETGPGKPPELKPRNAMQFAPNLMVLVEF